MPSLAITRVDDKKFVVELRSNAYGDTSPHCESFRENRGTFVEEKFWPADQREKSWAPTNVLVKMMPSYSASCSRT